MISNPLVFFTNKGVIVLEPKPMGPFTNSDLAVSAAEKRFDSSFRGERGGVPVDGFILIPAEKYVFGPDGKAVAKPLVA